mmetsp:Transcript_11551/g.48524  ORF Transcript_11551/g.48524 Transcript_11551/m.48524 type:complete len:459 (-) Transcript_11551:149-1525(-)
MMPATPRSAPLSSSVKKVQHAPLRPARPVRPTRCTYACAESGASYWMTDATPLKSSPREPTSVRMSVHTLPARNCSTTSSRCARVRPACSTPARHGSYRQASQSVCARSWLEAKTSAGVSAPPPASRERSASSLPFSSPTYFSSCRTVVADAPRTPTVMRSGAASTERASASAASGSVALKNPRTTSGCVHAATAASASATKSSSSSLSASSSTRSRTPDRSMAGFGAGAPPSSSSLPASPSPSLSPSPSPSLSLSAAPPFALRRFLLLAAPLPPRTLLFTLRPSAWARRAGVATSAPGASFAQSTPASVALVSRRARMQRSFAPGGSRSLSSRRVCCASSAVGESRSTFTPPPSSSAARPSARARRSLSIAATAGSRNARVLPDPVGATPSTSAPEHSAGTAWLCTGVGVACARSRSDARTVRGSATPHAASSAPSSNALSGGGAAPPDTFILCCLR